INEVFNEMKADKLSTRELLERLVAKEDGPWAAWFEDALKHDKLKTAGSRLAGKLKRYKIKPDKLRFGEETANGYSRACFERAWKLNLPASQCLDGTNGTTEQNPDFQGENERSVNVPSTPNLMEHEHYEGKIENVPSVPCVPSTEQKPVCNG